MRTRTLGRTGIEVSELSLGGLFVASFGAAFDQAKAAVGRSLDAGVNYIDTAPTYGDSETVLGKILRELDRPVMLSTKLGGRPTPFDPRDPAHLRESLETSLELLGRDHIDLLMVHEPDRPGQYDWWTDMLRVEGPVLELLDDFKREGLIRHTGLGGTTVYEMAHLCRSGKFDVVLTAFNYSLLFREAEQHLIPVAKEQNMGVIVGSPLQQGALAKPYDLDNPALFWLSPQRREQLRTLYAFADEVGMTLPELSLRMTISNADISCVLMGARSPEEVEQNVVFVERGLLDGAVLRRLDEIAAMVPARPYEEPAGLGWRLGNPGGYRGPGGVR